MAFINMLEIVYPVGSVYISTASTSPAGFIGGTWEQIKGAVLGATGANSFGTAATYGGGLKIATTQLPSHNHSAVNGENSELAYTFVVCRSLALDALARTRVSVPSSGNYYTITSNRSASDSAGINDIGANQYTSSTGGGKTTYPTTSRYICGIEFPNPFFAGGDE